MANKIMIDSNFIQSNQLLWRHPSNFKRARICKPAMAFVTDIYIGIFVFPFAFLDTTFCSRIKKTILKVISCKCDLSQRSEFMRDTGVTIKSLSLDSGISWR